MVRNNGLLLCCVHARACVCVRIGCGSDKLEGFVLALYFYGPSLTALCASFYFVCRYFGQDCEVDALRQEVFRLRAENARIPGLLSEVSRLHGELEAQAEQAEANALAEAERRAERSSLGHHAIETSPLRGGRDRQILDVQKALLSKDGSGMRGRPPPGAAGRDLREAHEKV